MKVSPRGQGGEGESGHHRQKGRIVTSPSELSAELSVVVMSPMVRSNTAANGTQCYHWGELTWGTYMTRGEKGKGGVERGGLGRHPQS